MTGGLSEVQNQQPGMILLITLAITVACVPARILIGMGRSRLLAGTRRPDRRHVAGALAKMKASGQAGDARAALAELLPHTAERVTDDLNEDVATDDLCIDAVVLVRPGGRVPAGHHRLPGRPG